MTQERIRISELLHRHAPALRAAFASTSTFACALVVSFVLSGCISLNLGQSKAERSAGVTFNEPVSPFQKLQGGSADGAWQNRQNGNSISYHSSCEDPADPSLDLVIRDLFADFKDMKVLKRETTQFNGREAEVAEVEGLVDGVKTRVHAVVFKKNNCLYTLSYIGVTPSFDADHGRFEDFLGSFRAP